MSFLWQEFWMHIWPSQLNNDTTASPNVTDHPIHLFMPEKTSFYFLIICAGCILGCIFLIRFIATGVSNNQRARVTNTDWNKFMAQRHCFQSSGFFLFPALFLMLIEIKKKKILRNCIIFQTQCSNKWHVHCLWSVTHPFCSLSHSTESKWVLDTEQQIKTNIFNEKTSLLPSLTALSPLKSSLVHEGFWLQNSHKRRCVSQRCFIWFRDQQ